MKLKIEIMTDGAAFDKPATEISKTLRRIAADIEFGVLPEAIFVRDLNGDRCGKVEVEA